MQGRWIGKMPGVHRLAKEFQINRKVVDAAIELLEKEGLLVPQGVGKRRLIQISGEAKATSALRVSIILHERDNRDWDLILKLHDRLLEAGYSVHYAPKSLNELGMNPSRIAGMVVSIKADAWVVVAASKEVLEWFADQPVPTFAFLGRVRRSSLASTTVESIPAHLATVRHLVAMGHRRIVLIQMRINREPEPAFLVQSILEEMQTLGILTGAYNLPDWEETPEGLFACLDNLFSLTPPHALVACTPLLYNCIHKHLLEQGIKVPQDVSLICNGPDPIFSWHRPEVSHIDWDQDILIRHTVNWLKSVERGRPTKRQSVVKAKFVEGGTIGPVRNRS